MLQVYERAIKPAVFPTDHHATTKAPSVKEKTHFPRTNAYITYSPKTGSYKLQATQAHRGYSANKTHITQVEDCDSAPGFLILVSN